jgi:cytochrome c oxidase subunit II
VNALTPPERVYMKPLGKDEKLWLSFAVAWCLILFVSMYAWQGIGRQQTPIESYRIDVAEFRALSEAFIAQNQVGNINGVPVVTPNANSEAYLAAQSFIWRPVLQLRKGETVRIYLSSYDVQHGLSIQPLNLNFQALPGYVYVVHLTPAEVGEYPIICNEYCGLGHHGMAGRIVVTD